MTSEQRSPAPERDLSMSPLPLKRVLYTAEAVVEGGRNGHGRTGDGRLDVDF